jgi:hypothetical protein
MPTEGLPGAPTVAVLKVRTAGAGAAVAAAGRQRASAITRAKARRGRLFRTVEKT